MESNIKHRILSQQQRNPYQKAHKQDRNIPRTLKKIPSLHAEPSSVTRAIQKLGRAAHIKYREAVQSKERRRDANQNESSEFANEKSNFMRKVSQNNLRNVEHLLQKNELTNYKSSLHVLVNAEFGEKIKLQKLKKGKDIQRIYFTKGNNHQLLKELFVDKYGFNETPVRQNASICWLQSSSQKDNSKILSKSIYQDHLPDIKRRKTESKVIYNYLEGQSQLTNKQKLYKNMSRAYPQAISTYIPRSFIIDFRLDEAQIHQHLLQFMAYYFKKDKNKRPRNKSIFIKNYYADITVSNKQLNRLIEKSEQLDQDKHQKSIEKQKVETNDNLWILKPTYLNRGRGIHLFATLKQLSKLLSQTSFQISVKMYSDNAKPMTYIIQEYIDRPLLIDGYKFDMRFWVMLQVVKLEGRKTLKAYLFQQGYIRLASVKYEVAAEKQEQNQKQEAREDRQKEKKEKKAYINNKFIHLTNNAVQKDAKQYGQFCEGNQLSLQTMLHYFHQKNQDCPLNLQQLQQNVAKIVRESISCVKDKLIDLNHTKTFQLLGYDFLLDQNYMMWLIQANCNPCLQESSGLVGGLLRQMISGLIHLTHLAEGKGPNQSHGWVQLL